MTPAANPEIYGKDVNKNSLPDISKTVKEQTKELNTYQSILEDLEKNVILKQTEIEKQKLRNIAYATNANRGATKDRNAFALSLKDKPGYLAPKDVEQKVFYDITFRLKELGFAQNIDLSQKPDYNDKLAREIIAFQKLAQLKGQEGVVGPETYKALLKNNVVASTILWSAPVSYPDELENAYDYANQNGLASTEQSGVSFVTDEQIKNAKPSDIKTEIIKKFGVATILSNNMDNISEEELKIFEKLDGKVNKWEKLYMEFENSVVSKIEKQYINEWLDTPASNIRSNVSDLLKNYSEGYLEDNEKTLKEIELDPKVFFAIRDTIVEFLFDSNKTTDQKRWLILFVRSFTDNFNDILQNCEQELRKSALSSITMNTLLNK